MKVRRILLIAFFLALGDLVPACAQSSMGTFSGVIADQNDAVIPDAAVSIHNTSTGFSRSTSTNSDGRYRFVNIPSGTYELTAEAPTFAPYHQQGIVLDVEQTAVINLKLKPGTALETVNATENASFVNSTNTEVSAHLDSNRIGQLPTTPNGNVYSTVLLAPGVNQVRANQAGFALGIQFSSNGNRVRSNNFTLDGQDVNDPNLTGAQVPLNNPDAIGEVQIVTNQFLAEYGRNSGSVVNFVTKSGTNQYHGSGFVFYNGGALNSCSNLDEAAGFCNPDAANGIYASAPPRKEFRSGFTVGGPLTFPWFGDGGEPLVHKAANSFFFADYLKWTGRQYGSGVTINGAPTAAGRATLQQYFGSLPQVQALLKFVPPGTANFSNVTADGQAIEVGDLTGSSPTTYDATQGSIRIDQILGKRNLLYGRYRGSASTGVGEQVTPPGLGTVENYNTYLATVVWNSSFTDNLQNDVQFAWTRLDARYTAQNPDSATIPSIEIIELGMNGPAHYPGRTAFGQATNLPQGRKTDLYQLRDSVTYLKGRHSLKFGVDLRRRDVTSYFFANARGRLLYTTLDDFVNDRAQLAAINLPLRGGDRYPQYAFNETYAYVHDEWRVSPTFVLTLGLRYEYPGDSFGKLEALNRRIVAANGNDPAFLFSPQPSPDTNNLMPRVGFSWSPQTTSSGLIGFLTGGDKAVIRGGYARNYDASYLVINALVFNSFPFVAIQPVMGPQPSFVALQSLRGASRIIPSSAFAMQIPRTSVAADFRLPSTDQVSLDYQRELTRNMVIRIGYAGTWGNGLLQTVDGNPRLPCAYGPGLVGTNTCNNSGINPYTGAEVPTVLAPRRDPTRGTVLLRANSASSSYNALQASFEKRFSHGLAANVYYTWSKFIDTASDIFDGYVMDPFNPGADRARSLFDYPQRLSANAVYQLRFGKARGGFSERVLGGWQVSTIVTLQSGAPFSVLNGSDPAGAQAGIDVLGGVSVRPNVYTNLDVSHMSVAELYTLNQKLRNQALATAAANFNALPPGPCVPGMLPGAPLNNLLFARAAARITCSATGAPAYTVDFNGVEPGQRFGTAGRNILRSDGLQLVDLSVAKNTQLNERFSLQLRADVYNLFNHRNFGVPDAQVNSNNFLNQWATDGGNRRIVVGMKVLF